MMKIRLFVWPWYIVVKVAGYNPAESQGTSALRNACVSGVVSRYLSPIGHLISSRLIAFKILSLFFATLIKFGSLHANAYFPPLAASLSLAPT